MGIGALKRGYMAQYENKSKAFVVKETSPDAANRRLGETPNALRRIGGSQDRRRGFTATDKYLGKLAIVRKGHYIVGYTNVPETADATALASRWRLDCLNHRVYLRIFALIRG